jgi:hypothetical protein
VRADNVIVAGVWQESWDREQEACPPDREQRFAAMLEVLDAVSPPAHCGIRRGRPDLARRTGRGSRRLTTGRCGQVNVLSAQPADLAPA